MNHKLVEYVKQYVQAYMMSVLCLAMIIFLFGSIWTFSLHDESIFYHARYGLCKNIFGYSGATVAAFLVYLFGSAAYTLLFFLSFILWCTIGVTSVRKENDRIAGFVLLIMTNTMLCNLYFIGYHQYSSPGGVVGQFLMRGLSYFDMQAQKLILYGMLFASIVLILRFAHLFIARIMVKGLYR